MGMTVLERDVMESTKRMNKAVAKHLEEVDWEQRRYEIAKEMLPSAALAMNNSTYPDWAEGMTHIQSSAVLAVHYADALITELKK